MEELIPRNGGFKRLLSFQVAQLAYDVTVRFCDRYIDRRSRTHDQMVQAARSGVQNIAEGSLASATSKKTELRLTNVARASLGELRQDYEDFLRQRRMPLWAASDPRRRGLVDRRCKSADEVALWVREVAWQSLRAAQSTTSTSSSQSSRSPQWAHYAEGSANAGHILTCVAFSLLDRQLTALGLTFQREGGFSERMYRLRNGQRTGRPPATPRRPG